MAENQATAEPGALPSESQWRPSALMTRYDEPSTPVQNAADAVSNEGQTSDATGTEQVEGAGSEPTPSGIDANSPAARHFQSVADRMIAKAKADSDTAMAAVRAELAGVRAQLQSQGQPRQEQAQQSPGNSNGLALDWTKAPKFQAPEGGYFDEASIEAINRAQEAKIQWTIEQIQQQQMQVIQQTQAQAAEQALIGFAQGLEPTKQSELVGLVREYESIARQNPDAFIAFAKVQLGIHDGSQKSASPASPTLAPQQPVIPSSRPTRNATMSPRHDANATLEDKVRANVRRAMGG